MKYRIGLFLVVFFAWSISSMGQNLTVQLNPSSPSPNDFMFVVPTTAGTKLGSYVNSSMQMNYKGSNSRFSKITVRKNPTSLYPGMEVWVRAGQVIDDPNNTSFGIATDPVLVTDNPQTIIQHIKTPSNGSIKIRNVYITINAVDYSLLAANRYNVNLIFEHVFE